ncbi:MAG: tRNA (guanosine(37)-N1)-methyltransferase TrmD [bacterium]|nr:tRNA (guanosine(37)-N1)-methyltransferase TrmD [bacterium]
MTYHIITLFPAAFDSYLNESILKRAIEDKKIKVKFYNPRDFTKGTSYADRRVDDKPYGGGPGMVIEALPVIKAIAKAKGNKNAKIIWFTPSGKQFDTKYAKEAATKHKNIIFICGRYEGIDARVKKTFKVEEISVGPFVLTGGELPAMLLIDSISRQIPGVLGDMQSLEESRIASPDVYTRPEVVEYKGKKYRVPKVLLSGNHKLINEWRRNKK